MSELQLKRIAELEVYLHNQTQAVRDLTLQVHAKNVTINRQGRKVVEQKQTNDYLHRKISELDKRVNFLSCLEMAGVDNWEGYSHAYDVMKEHFPEQYAETFGDNE